MRAQSRSVDAGQSIYAYCNVRSNQVLYSLTCQLQNRTALKQLPDAGANNNPPKLRKDLWRPLWTLTLPGTASGQQQRLDAFEQLRRYRTLHEYTWKPFEFFSRKYTEEEIEEMKEKLKERGGGKKESVYDVIKHQQRKLRARYVMDQKANSIADLAAVLLNQEKDGSQTIEAYMRLAQSEAKSSQESGATDEDTQASQSSKTEAPSSEQSGAKDEVMPVPQSSTGENPSESPLARATEDTDSAGLSNIKANKQSAAQVSQSSIDENTSESLVASTPENADAVGLSSSEESAQPNIRNEVEEKKIEQKFLNLQKGHSLPVFTTEGVRISWDHILDAEFAQAWPEDVEHAHMGLFRNTAPNPEKAPVSQVASFKQARRKIRHPPTIAEHMQFKNGIRPAVVDKLKKHLIKDSPIWHLAPRMLKQLGAENQSRMEKRLIEVLETPRRMGRRESVNKA